MNAPIKFSTQKGEGGTVGYSVMTLLLLYRLLSETEKNCTKFLVTTEKFAWAKLGMIFNLQFALTE